MLKQINLYNKKDFYPSMLSGGMKRRLSVALTAMKNHRICFFDEPTNGLDPINQKLVIDLIEEMKR